MFKLIICVNIKALFQMISGKLRNPTNCTYYTTHCSSRKNVLKRVHRVLISFSEMDRNFLQLLLSVHIDIVFSTLSKWQPQWFINTSYLLTSNVPASLTPNHVCIRRARHMKLHFQRDGRKKKVQGFVENMLKSGFFVWTLEDYENENPLRLPEINFKALFYDKRWSITLH